MRFVPGRRVLVLRFVPGRHRLVLRFVPGRQVLMQTITRNFQKKYLLGLKMKLLKKCLMISVVTYHPLFVY
jgi:hypothetical protein